MKVKVIRGYSGEEGDGPDKDVREGSEHSVTRVRGNQLWANGLVEILEDEADDEDEEVVATEDAKTITAPLNKAARRPANKSTGA